MFGKLLVTLAVVLLLGCGSAQAARLFFEFGKDETLHSIQDVAAKGPNGEALVLAYKTTTMWFFGSVYMTDDGYVLRLKSGSNYFQVKPELVAALQAKGGLPNPLPPYHLGFFDYFIGYALWTVVIPVCVIYVLIDTWRRRRRAAAGPGAT